MADSSFFIFHYTSTIIYLLLYVDDIIITGNNSAHIAQLIVALSTIFELKDLGSLNYFLGIQISHSKFGITLTQSKYAFDILYRFHMENSKPTKTPCCPSTKLLLMMVFLSLIPLSIEVWWVLFSTWLLHVILSLVFTSFANL